MSSKKPANPDPAATHTAGQPKTSSGNLNAYARQQKVGTPAPQRDIEARALLKAARMLTDIQTNWETTPTEKRSITLEESIKFNRQIWVMFYDSAIQNNPPQKNEKIRSNVISLASFIFSKSMDVIAEPDKDKLDILININREIAAGLMSNTP